MCDCQRPYDMKVKDDGECSEQWNMERGRVQSLYLRANNSREDLNRLDWMVVCIHRMNTAVYKISCWQHYFIVVKDESMFMRRFIMLMWKLEMKMQSTSKENCIDQTPAEQDTKGRVYTEFIKSHFKVALR